LCHPCKNLEQPLQFIFPFGLGPFHYYYFYFRISYEITIFFQFHPSTIF
jgi:hypothetical protein